MKKYKIILVSFILLLIVIGCYYLSLVSRAGDLVGAYPVYNLQKKQYELVKKRPGHWVALKDISKEARFAIMISEDWAFFEHKGYDLNQINIVLKESFEEKKLVRGASTITQQVVKNTLLSNERSLIRKFKEFILAREIEKRLKKNQILEIYLNLIELGENLYGIKRAANFYFQKTPSFLSAKEGAFLAMLLPSPKKYSQSFREKKLTKFASSQVSKILLKLQQVHIISSDQRELFENERLSFEVLDMPIGEIDSVEGEIDSELLDDKFLKSKLKTNIKIDPIIK